MSSFSQVYMNSIIVKTMLEKIPEQEREAFIESVRRGLEQYDALAGLGWERSSIAELLRGDAGNGESGDRRPPRRR